MAELFSARCIIMHLYIYELKCVFLFKYSLILIYDLSNIISAFCFAVSPNCRPYPKMDQTISRLNCFPKYNKFPSCTKSGIGFRNKGKMSLDSMYYEALLPRIHVRFWIFVPPACANIKYHRFRKTVPAIILAPRSFRMPSPCAVGFAACNRHERFRRSPILAARPVRAVALPMHASSPPRTTIFALAAARCEMQREMQS